MIQNQIHIAPFLDFDIRSYPQRYHDERSNHRTAVSELTRLVAERTNERNSALWIIGALVVAIIAMAVSR